MLQLVKKPTEMLYVEHWAQSASVNMQSPGDAGIILYIIHEGSRIIHYRYIK